MYNSHFGFSESPFNITPNSRFYFRTQSCDEILKIVQHGIESRKGVIVVTGEPGTGKTLLLKFLERDLSPTVKTVILQNPHTNFDRMLEQVLNRLDLHGPDDRTARLDRLTGHLIEQRSQGGIVCVLIDEAQDLDANTLDELRLLANLEVDGDALLPFLLIGQPELNLKLDHPSATRIKQRVALTRNTYPLVRMEIAPYIQWRLKVAGFEKSGLFDAEAIDIIAAYSGGIPRLVNSICDNSLIRVYTANQKKISAEIIDQVARDLRIARPFALERQFTRARLGDISSDSAPIAGDAACAADELQAGRADQEGAEFVGAGRHAPGTALAQDSHPAILNNLEAEDMRAITEPNTMLDAIVPADHRESTEGLPGFHPETGAPRDLAPVRLRWYAVAAVIGLLLLVLNTMSSSQLAGIYSASSSANRATVMDASPYQSLHGEITHGVEFIGSVVALSRSNPATLSPRRIEIAASQPPEGKGDRKYAPRNANGNSSGAVKASQTQLRRDDEPRREGAADLPAGNANRSEDSGKTVKVVATSLLRNKPSANAKIISSLEPGSRVTVLARSGDFYHIRSVDKKPIRGYVHREDAFFERKK